MRVGDLLKVKEKHLAGHEAPLLDDIPGGDRQHADLGPADHALVLGHVVPGKGNSKVLEAWC